MNKKVVKGLKIAGNVVLWIFLLFALLMTVMVISSTSRSDGLPQVFGRIMITVESDSMKPEFKKSDMIFDLPLTVEETLNLEEDDIITFYADLDGDGDDEINTHKIIEVIKGTGNTTYKTKGVNNEFADNYTVSSTDVLGKYSGSKLGGVGGVIAFLRTSLGFFLCIILPLILFFIWELYSFIKTLVAVKAAKAAEAGLSPDVEEAIRQRAIEDYLKEQAAKAASAEAKSDDKPENGGEDK